MNIQQLKSLAAILECQSFSSAASKIGLSHSAISLQIKSLEEEFGHALFDRSTRPPRFTPTGRQTAEMAQKALRAIHDVKLAGSGKMQQGMMAIGVVPTTLRDILPFILKQVQENYTHIRMTVKSGLSGDLTSLVLNGELDLAIVTSPSHLIADLQVHEIATEPLFAIGEKSIEALSDSQLLHSRPYIAFSRKTWLGQQIFTRLQSRGIYLDEIMEVNSLDAIERMVRDGHGVSIVPQRFMAKPLSENLTSIPFCSPQEIRRLVLIRRKGDSNAGAMEMIMDILVRI